MARTPKPWFWKERGCWFVTIRGERKNLGPYKKQAIVAFHELMNRTGQSRRDTMSLDTEKGYAFLIDLSP